VPKVPADTDLGDLGAAGYAGPNAASVDLPSSLVRAGAVFKETDHGSIVRSMCHLFGTPSMRRLLDGGYG